MTYIPGGSGGAPTTAKYITQVADAGLSDEQALSSLTTGLVKVTNGTGVLSTATAGTDYAAASHTHAASDIASGTMATARLGSGTANGTTFLRGDQTWAAPTAAVAATTIEVDVGTPRFSGQFTITDAAIGATSKVLCWQAPGPYTGKGTRADEAAMQPVAVLAVVPGSGSADVHWATPPMLVQRPRALTGGQPASTIIPGLKDPTAIAHGEVRRLGRVRGNVKFTYTVMA